MRLIFESSMERNLADLFDILVVVCLLQISGFGNEGDLPTFYVAMGPNGGLFSGNISTIQN